jgi:cytochrome c oxidase subunit III
MTAMTIEAPHGAIAHEGEAHHEEEHDHAGMNRLGLLLFMASETMLFLAMAAARFYLTGTARPAALNVGLGLVLTAILLASSFAGYRGVGAITKGNRSGFITWIGIAAFLGIVFIGGVVVEWTGAATEFPVGTPYGTAFYAMTGLHVFHLLQGLLGLGLLLWLGVRGHFGPDDHWGATAVVRFWTFVDIMWLAVVFPVLYLL